MYVIGNVPRDVRGSWEINYMEQVFVGRVRHRQRQGVFTFDFRDTGLRRVTETEAFRASGISVDDVRQVLSLLEDGVGAPMLKRHLGSRNEFTVGFHYALGGTLRTGKEEHEQAAEDSHRPAS